MASKDRTGHKCRALAQQVKTPTGVVAVLLGFSAFAQQSSDPPMATAPSAADNSLTEIVVTSTKYATTLDRAPVSATELDSRTLETGRIQDVEDVQALVPSLQYDSAINYAQAYIRGIGSNFSLAGLESSVATYVDGVYLERQLGANLDVLDLASVQVLKGPQGALYGRNATGGAIVIESADPTTDKFGGFAGVEYGTYNRTKVQAVVNLPVNDTLAIRIAAQELTQGGYLNDTVSGGKLGYIDSQFFRGKVKWTPGDAFAATYSLEYSRNSSNTYGQHQRLNAPLCLACAIYDITPANGFYDATQAHDPRNTVEYVANTLKLEYTADMFGATSITSFRRTSNGQFNDQDNTSANFYQGYISETGPTFFNDSYVRTKFKGPLNFIAGLSYMYDKNSQDTLLFGPIFAPLGSLGSHEVFKLNSISGYAEGDYAITDEFKFTAGARYDIDHKRLDVNNSPNTVLVYGTDAYTISRTYDELTPQAVFSHDSAAGYYYLSYSKGAKSGGFSTPSLTPPIPVHPETLDSFEIGAKNEFLNQTLKTNVALFYGKYDQVQVEYVDLSAGGVRVANAASAKVYGLEADVRWRALEGLNVAAGGDYLHNTFKDYPGAAAYAPNPAGIGLSAISEDLSGSELPHAPRYSIYTSADYQMTIPGGWHVTFAGTDRYTARYLFQPGAGGPLGLDQQPGFNKLDGSITLAVPSERTEIGIFGKNLTNSRYLVFTETSVLGAFYVPAEPITYGIRIKQKF